MKYLILPLILLTGCSYVSQTNMTIKGDDIRVPFGITSIKGDNIDTVVTRSMDVKFLYPKK